PSAASFNFPPENLITLVACGFFGDVTNQPYWGRWYLWEACAFIGVTGVALAVYGMTTVKMAGKKALLTVAAIAALLALGNSTPLFRILFDWLPLFDRFRGAGKFMFITALVLVLLAGYGLDRILRERNVPMRAVWVGGAIAVALCAAATAIRTVDWSVVTAAVLATGQTYVDRPVFPASQAFASLGLLLAGLTLAAAVCLALRSEEHTSELQSPCNLVCRLLLEKKKKTTRQIAYTPPKLH